jgi:hypothetical protein
MIVIGLDGNFSADCEKHGVANKQDVSTLRQTFDDSFNMMHPYRIVVIAMP